MTKLILGFRTVVESDPKRFLFISDNADVLLVHHAEKATRFTRDEANTVLLTLAHHDNWALAGHGTYPCLREVRS